MKKSKVFIIGGGNEQTDFILTVKKSGYEAIVFDYNPECAGVKIADKFYCISIDKKEEILDIAKKEKPIAIHTVATEAGNITSCYVGEKLGLCTNSYSTALNTVDKNLMKRVFEDNNIPTARVLRLYSRSDIENIDFPFPLVVKASDRSAARGISLVNNFDELVEAYDYAYFESNNKIVLIEEYVKGEQYSLEAVSQNGIHYILAVTREFFTNEKEFVESHDLLPSFNEEEIIVKFESLFIRIFDAFHIKYGASHTEFRIHENKINIIEIASRSGGMRDKLLDISKSIDYNSLILNSILNKPIEVCINRNGYALSKPIFTCNDLRLYESIKDKYLDNIIVHPKNIHNLQTIRPTTLIDAKGVYYLRFSDKKIVDEILKQWEKGNYHEE